MSLIPGQRTNTGLINTFIDSAFDTVKKVADNMPAILEVVGNAQLVAANTATTQQNAVLAQTAATEAASSQVASLDSQNAAHTSELSAAASAVITTADKLACDASAQAALASEQAANTSKVAAAASEAASLANKNAAQNSQTAAATSAIAAGNSETAALASKNAAALSETNAAASEAAALASKNAAAASEASAGTSAINAGASKDAAAVSAANAYISENAAAMSESNANASKIAAAASEAAALVSKNASAISETNAGDSAASALASKNAATLSETNAGNSASAALASKNAAAISETNSAAHDAAALASKNAAVLSESTALGYKNAAEVSKNAAAVSETNAADSDAAALAHKNAAAASDTSALASKNASALSETNAYASETAAGNSAAAANNSKVAAANSEANALSHKNAADSSKTAAAGSATAAATSEANALSYKNAADSCATAAATSETNALAHKNAAATSAANALSYKNAAGTSATAAGDSAAAAALSETNAWGSASAAAASAAQAQKYATIVASALIFRGGWSAAGGVFPTPNLDPETSDYYRITVGGTMTGTQGSITVTAGDFLHWDMDLDKWFKVDAVDAVTSVAGRTGDVTLTKTDVGLANVPNTDATNASNITSGTLAAARLPASINAATTGNAATATKLATARTINGVAFDGTANITVADSTKLPLTGGVLTGGLCIGDGTAPANPTVVGDLEHYLEVRGTTATYPSALGVAFHHEGISTSALVHGQLNGDTGYFNLRTDDPNLKVYFKDQEVWDSATGLRASKSAAGVTGNYTNWDSLTLHGVYKINSPDFVGDTNPPPSTYGYGILHTDVAEFDGEGRIMQIYYPHGQDLDRYFYQRMRNAGGWTAWAKIWRGGTGDGSGLDADLLDGLDSSQFIRSDAADTITGALTSTSTISATQLIATSNGTGTSFKVGDDAWFGDVNLSNTTRLMGVQDNTKGYLIFGNGDSTALGRSGTGDLTYGGYKLWHYGNDGAGSRLDADLLDGQEGAYYCNASNINAGTIGDAYLPATISSNITGNAGTATKLATARTITLGGDLSGSATFDGSANATITAALSDAGVLTSCAAAAAGGVGTYMLAKVTTSSALKYGGTYAASVLNTVVYDLTASRWYSSSAVVLAGTWRCLGYNGSSSTNGATAALFLRIS